MHNWSERTVRPRSRGHALVSALLAAATVFAIGLSVLSRVTAETRLSRQAVDFERALQAANAGLEDCLGYLTQTPEGQAALLDATGGEVLCDRTFSGDGVSYHARAVAAENGWQARITSTGRAGTVNRANRQVSAVLQKTNTFGGRAEGHAGTGLTAWAGGDIRFAGNGVIVGQIYSRGDIVVSGRVTVCGDFYAGGEAVRGNNVRDGEGCSVSFISHYPFVAPPDFGIGALQNSAAIIVPGDHTPQCPPYDQIPAGLDPAAVRGPECSGPASGEKVIWVLGKLNLEPYQLPAASGPGQGGGGGQPIRELYYEGNVTYIAGGGIDVSIDNLDRAPGATLRFIAPGPGAEIMMTANGTLRGVFVAPQGTVRTPGRLTLYGLIHAEEWENSGTLEFFAEGYLVPPADGGSTDRGYFITKMWEH